jgi:predicted metal-binding protein
VCFKCDCDHYEQCSIVGQQPHGFCCPMCFDYDETHTCPNYVAMHEEIQKLITGEFHILPTGFCLKTQDPKKIENVMQYP